MLNQKEFKKLTSADEALKLFLNNIKPKSLDIINVSLNIALNRILAQDIVAKKNSPRFDRSAVDGYAVKAENTFSASLFNPKLFRIITEDVVGNMHAKEIWTGNSIPKGANAVVMLEYTKQTNNQIEVWVSVTPAENISKRGEDVTKGEVALQAGICLKPQHLGLLASLGIQEVKVFAKPKIAILASGNELVEIGSVPKENQIFEINNIILSALCRELGAEVMDLGITKDNTDDISEKLKIGLKKADAIITTGGTSVGIPDLVPDAVNKIGKPGILVHGIAIRPGMPTALAIVDRKPLVILSGNPVASMVGFEVFVRPLIFRILGLKCEELRPTIKAKLTRRLSKPLGRKTFVRVHTFQLNEDFFAEPVSIHGSGLLSSMTKSNGFVIIPENIEGLEKGEYVTVRLFDVIPVVDEDV